MYGSLKIRKAQLMLEALSCTVIVTHSIGVASAVSWQD